jgi:hypothetical protein
MSGVAALHAPRAAPVVVEQHAVNLGNRIEIDQGARVLKQYGDAGAEGDFVTVLESPKYGDDGLISQFNVQTWVGPPNLPDPDEVSGRALALLGKLSWGIGGARFTADFDWKTGNQLSFAASFFRIDIAYSEVGESCPDRVSVGAMQSSGGRASRSQVTRTYPKLLIDDENPVIFPIPPYAHALYLFANDEDFYGDDTGTPNVKIRYVGGASAGFSAVSTDLESFNVGAGLFKTALTCEDGVRFPEAARFVEVSTAVESTTYRFTPCFTLNF